MAFNPDRVEQAMRDNHQLEANATFVDDVERVTLKLAGNYYHVCSAIQDLSNMGRLDISLQQPVGTDAEKWDIVLVISLVNKKRSAAEKFSDLLSS